jgi:hypothetical protein
VEQHWRARRRPQLVGLDPLRHQHGDQHQLAGQL